MNQVEIGNIAEARFVSDAIAKGFSPAVPWGGQKGYDVVLTAGKRHFRVQVKSCTYHYCGRARKSSSFRVELRSTNSLNQKRKGVRTSRGYDILAVWLPTEARWVFVTAAYVGLRTGLTIALGTGVARSPDNWEIFRK